jgi:hypothetical protein
MMPELTFELGFETWEMNDLRLPITVRKANSMVVARTLSTESVEVDAGTYFVTAELPGGYEITRPVELAESRRLLLEPDPEDRSAHEWDEERHFLGSRRESGAGFSRGTRSLQDMPADGGASLRIYTGNPLSGDLALQRWGDVLAAEHADAEVLYYRVLAPRPVLVQHLEPGTVPLNLMVPPEGRLAYSRRGPADPSKDSRYKIEVFSRNPTANLQLRLGRNGAYDRAADASEAEELLRDKIRDPVAAAVGAYTLLRAGQLERLHEWTANLCKWFEWLPDGAAVRGEHEARRGRHAEALESFLLLAERGLPLFADGLSYVYERLKTYARLRHDRSTLRVERAAELLKRIEPFAHWAHRQLPSTAFPGLDPTQPEPTVLTMDAPIEGALELPRLDPAEDAALEPG